MQLVRDPTDRKLHYTERFSEFILNGGIRRLQRHGLKADGNYGKIDNLHISYDGIKTVLEDADPVTHGLSNKKVREPSNDASWDTIHRSPIQDGKNFWERLQEIEF